jgi:hypothetical protein
MEKKKALFFIAKKKNNYFFIAKKKYFIFCLFELFSLIYLKFLACFINNFLLKNRNSNKKKKNFP